MSTSAINTLLLEHIQCDTKSTDSSRQFFNPITSMASVAPTVSHRQVRNCLFKATRTETFEPTTKGSIKTISLRERAFVLCSERLSN